ncbi:peroxiredoxin-like family protein [Pelagicoccus sp. SDUM812005]|uniref:peroxiredoxin-like family protein n=1 Tax=Pelagicoccus sp. SDUM812005 TaxID=3041257 RepID=UPI00280D7374|nr:peroxiredoxin-like family protein [Pelagicoccus sp. SDUM812005]MDQ8179483.1 peroxiredoxin-like family protein [Pelagicoccus sp. SDUM812005]
MRKLAFLLCCIASLPFAQARNADEVTPLLIGQKTPKVDVVDETGTKQFLPSLLKDKYSIVVFYRGGWCPYCSTHLQELAEAESQFLELGYQIIGISPDSPEMLASIEKDGDLPYSLYSDSGFAAIEGFGIDFSLNKPTLLKYKGYGIDLAKNSGGLNKDRLPAPAVFIVTPDNEIAFSYVNPNYKDRIPGDLLLAAAKAIKE